MAINNTQEMFAPKWWDRLRLPNLMSDSVATTELVGRYEPVGFRETSSGEVLSLDELELLITEAQQERERAALVARAERRAEDDRLFDSAQHMPDGGEVITEGRWIGFTRSDAAAWSWNLFQYEPQGFVSPGSQVRAQALQQLAAGELPEVFGYPERARELSDRGVTPARYREMRKALGSPMFDRADVKVQRS